MADYNEITTISGIDVNTPVVGAAPISELDDAIRQVKGLLKVLLAVAHADDGAIKANAVVTAAINNGAVSTDKLADLAVTVAKLGTDSVETVKIKDGAVTSSKLAGDAVGTTGLIDGSVTTAKLAEGAVTTEKLAVNSVDGAKLLSDSTIDSNRAVSSNHIKNGAITAEKLAAASISADKLNVAETNVLLWKGATLQAVQLGGVIGFDSLDVGTTPPTLKLKFASTSESGELEYFRLEQRASSGTPGGASVASTYTHRSSFWTESADPYGLVVASAGSFTFADAGTFMFRAGLPAYSVGKHRARLWNTTTGSTLLLGTVAVASPGNQSMSYIQGMVAVAAGTVLKIEHWTELTVASNGLGLPATITGEEEIYGFIEAIKA